MKNVTLVLSDGTTFCGESFGYEASVAGEVVFNTAMVIQKVLRIHLMQANYWC